MMTELTELGRLRLKYNALQYHQDCCEARGDNQESLDAREAKLEELERQIQSKIDQDFWKNQIGFFDESGNPIEPKVGEMHYDAVGGKWWMHEDGSSQRRPPKKPS